MEGCGGALSRQTSYARSVSRSWNDENSGSTLGALSYSARRPPLPSAPFPPDLSNHVPRARVKMDAELCHKNLRSVRRRTAGRPSGMTAEHLKGLPEKPTCNCWQNWRATSCDCARDGLRAISSDGWWRTLWPYNLLRTPKKRLLHSSTLWKPVQVRVRGTRVAGTDRSGRERNCGVRGRGGCVRPHIKEFHSMRDGEQLLPFARMFCGDPVSGRMR